MKDVDSEVRRALLKPLARRKATPARHDRIKRALDVLETRAIASALLPELIQAHKAARLGKSYGHWRDPAVAKAQITFVSAMLVARRMSLQEYAFVVASAVEGVHEGRLIDGTYAELKAISQQMRAVEAAHGLKDGEIWQLSDAPAEYCELNDKYVDADNKRFIEALRGLEGRELTELYLKDRREYDRLRERGRRSFFHKDETIAALADTIVRYEQEARSAASAQAFTAAVTLIGAAMEGLLLLRCLRSRTKAKAVAASLPKAKRPRDLSTPSQWSFDTLIHVCLSAGWLPEVTTESITIRPEALAHMMRQMRNHVHPGRVCRERAWIETESKDFSDAEIIYTTLFATLSSGPHRKRLLEAAAAPVVRHSAASTKGTGEVV